MHAGTLLHLKVNNNVTVEIGETHVSLSVKQGLGAIVIFVGVLQSAIVRHFLVSGSDTGEARQATDK